MELGQIGKYTLVDKVGQGAMGEVFKAHDPILNRHVAVKTMSAQISADADLRKRFQREAQSAARLNHPNIIAVYDFGEDQGRVYMVMELLEGTDLKEMIAQGSLTLDDKLRLMEQICEGLAFAHEAGVVHRDLKPANIHVLPNGQVKVMDFGLAKLGASEMTRTGMVMGTPHYMSPEQVRGQKADSRSDIFSLGAMFYELLTNRKPFDAESLHAVLFQVLEHEPEPVRHWVPDLPEVLVQLVERALFKDPLLRFQNAREMREAMAILQQVMAGELAEDAGLASVLEMSPSTEATFITDGEGDPRIDGTSALDPAQRPGSSRTLSGSARTQSTAPASRSSVSRAGRSTSNGTPIPSRTPVPSRTAPTMLGRGSTQMGGRPARPGPPTGRPQRSMAVAPPPSRMPLYLGGGAAAVVIAVVAILMFRPSTPLPTPTPTQTAAPTPPPVGDKVKLAQLYLDTKKYREAITESDGILKLDPGNSEATRIKAAAETTLKTVDEAVAAARNAVAARDLRKARTALDRVMNLDPGNPVVKELAEAMNAVYQGEAKTARDAALRARTAAEQAKATGQPSFAQGEDALGDGNATFGAGQFTVSVQKFAEAQAAFDRARRAGPLVIATHTPIPTPSVVTPPPSLATPTPTPISTPTPTPTPVRTPPPVNEDPAVRQAIADYGRAFEQKDLGAIKRLRPTLSGDEEGGLRNAFRSGPALKYQLNIDSIKIDGGQATLRVTRIVSAQGVPSSTTQQTYTLTKGPAGWTISSIQ